MLKIKKTSPTKMKKKGVLLKKNEMIGNQRATMIRRWKSHSINFLRKNGIKNSLGMDKMRETAVMVCFKLDVGIIVSRLQDII